MRPSRPGCHASMAGSISSMATRTPAPPVRVWGRTPGPGPSPTSTAPPPPHRRTHHLAMACRWPRSSAIKAGGRPGSPPLARFGDEFSEELLNPAVDLVADAADDLDGLAGGVLELPVLIALARIDRAGIATAHGDDHIRGLDRGLGERLGELPGQIDAQLAHGRYHRRVEPVSRVGAGRADLNLA